MAHNKIKKVMNCKNPLWQHLLQRNVRIDEEYENRLKRIVNAYYREKKRISDKEIMM